MKLEKKKKIIMATHDFTRPEFEKEAIKLSHGLIYANLTDKQKDYILSLMPKEHQNILRNWLKDIMIHNHVPINEQKNLSSQFLVEQILGPMKVASYKKSKAQRKGKKFEEEIFIDIYHIYEFINDMSDCDKERRNKFNNHLKTDDRERAEFYSAVGKIECVGGVYQWD